MKLYSTLKNLNGYFIILFLWYLDLILSKRAFKFSRFCEPSYVRS